MGEIVLKQGVSDAILSDHDLFCAVGKELKVSPTYLPRIVYAKSKKLTLPGVLLILKQHLGKGEDNELLETVQPVETKTTAA